MGQRRGQGLRLQAAGDLMRRYSAVFRQAWQERRRTDTQPHLRHETEFMPAALALQETPVSPAPRVAIGLIMAFGLIAVLWSVFGHIDVVAVAPGRIVPNDRTKVIQSFETATVKAIRVADGQVVKVGDVLIELDATTTTADSARIGDDLAAAHLQALRSKALLAAIGGNRPPLLQRLESVSAERHAQEQRILDGLYDEFRARLARLDADIVKREAELASTREMVRKLELTSPIARQRAQDLKDLAERNFMSKHGYLEKEQVRIEQEGELAVQRSRIAELTAALQEGRNGRIALVAETRRAALDSLNEAERRMSGFTQELIKADSRGRLMTLTAPVDGTVQQLAVHTVGGVVTPAQPLLMIVPRDHPVEVEAFLENKDIGFVNAGQAAVVKVETFPFTKYGTLPAKLVHVSNDAVNDEKRGLVFLAKVNLEQTTIAVENKRVNLSPGMAVTVEVQTGTRRVIEYFLAPLLRYRDESLRER